MSKHNKPNDNLGTGKDKPGPSSSPSTPKPGTPAGKARGTATAKNQPWTEVANFVITFERRDAADGGDVERRITAHKMQDDGITAKWTGVGQQPMCAWIADHLGDWANVDSSEPAMTEVGQTPTAAQQPVLDTTRLGVTITAMRALAPTDQATAADGGTHDGGGRTSFEFGQPFGLEALVEISGLGKTDAALIPPCSVQFFSRNTVTKEKAHLGEARIAHREGGQPSFRAILTPVRLAAGSYRVESVAVLRGKQPKLAYGKAPLLQVV